MTSLIARRYDFSRARRSISQRRRARELGRRLASFLADAAVWSAAAAFPSTPPPIVTLQLLVHTYVPFIGFNATLTSCLGL